MNRDFRLRVLMFFMMVACILSCSGCMEAEEQGKSRYPDYDVIPVLRMTDGEKKKNYRDHNNINHRNFTKLDIRGKELPGSASSWSFVRDDVTGRIWEKRTDDGSIHDKDHLYTFKEAEVYVETLNRVKYGGRSNWRIPTLKELSTIIDFDESVPSVNTRLFPDQHPSFYWSSTLFLDDPDYAWGVMFHQGEAYNHYKRIRFFVRAVCVDEKGLEFIKKFSDPSVRFHDNGDDTITDTANNIMWMKYPAVKGEGQNITNMHDLKDVRTMIGKTFSALGYSDWRIPNINELISIVDYSRRDPAIYPVFGSFIGYDCYFSSTVNHSNICMYVVYFKNGDFNTLGIDNPIRFVRTVSEKGR